MLHQSWRGLKYVDLHGRGEDYNDLHTPSLQGKVTIEIDLLWCSQQWLSLFEVARWPSGISASKLTHEVWPPNFEVGLRHRSFLFSASGVVRRRLIPVWGREPVQQDEWEWNPAGSSQDADRAGSHGPWGQRRQRRQVHLLRNHRPWGGGCMAVSLPLWPLVMMSISLWEITLPFGLFLVLF